MRGLKLVQVGVRQSTSDVLLQNTKIPVRGLKPYRKGLSSLHLPVAPSKHQNPREGIKTWQRFLPNLCHYEYLQNTKIPVRGLKHPGPYLFQLFHHLLQNTKIPVRGLKPIPERARKVTFSISLQNTKIPVRGLKRRCPTTTCAFVSSFKTPKSP